MKKIVAVINLVFIVLAIYLWQSTGRKIHSTEIFLMDTFIELKAQGSEQKAVDALKKSVEELKRIDAGLGYKGSLVDELNRSRIVKDKELYDLVRTSREVHDLSLGGFSITLRPILDAWGFTGLHPYRMPTPGEFSAWKRGPQDEAIRLHGDGMTVELPAGTRIDLGGITPGYAADRAGKMMRAHGIETGLVNIGGDIVAFGEKVWKIGIKNPRASGVFTVVPVKNRAISTAGDYERFFMKDGVRYSHTLDPSTGYPADHFMSVTVLADTCIEADAWDTAVSVKGPDALAEVLEKRGIDWITVDRTGKVRTSRNLASCCPGQIPLPPDAD